MENLNGEEKNQRVVTFLTREEVDYLDKIGKDALFSTGMKVSRAKLIAWLVEFLQKLRLSGDGIRSEKDFEKKVMEVLGRNFKGSIPPPATDGYH